MTPSSSPAHGMNDPVEPTKCSYCGFTNCGYESPDDVCAKKFEAAVSVLHKEAALRNAEIARLRAALKEAQWPV